MKSSLFFLLLITISLQVCAQESIALEFSKMISSSQIERDLKTLASARMEGRETGSKGQKLAANYIYHQFSQAKLLNQSGKRDSLGYFQGFSVYKQKLAKSEIKIASKTFFNYKDFLISGSSDYSNENMELVFLGTAPETSYQHKDYSGKAVLFLTSNLYAGAIKSNDILLASGAKLILFCNPNQPEQHKQLIEQGKSFSQSKFRLTTENYSRKNPFDSLQSPKKFKEFQLKEQSFQGAISLQIASEILHLKINSLKKLLTSKSTYSLSDSVSKINFRFDLQFEKTQTENVIAYLPGKEKPKEFIVISAHYDHIGKSGDQIFFGANDNASGTSAMMEIARKFQEAKLKGYSCKRSILFIAFTGEEKGLLGSEFFVSNTSIPLEKIVANLNIDMLGRFDEQHDSSNYIYLLGPSHLNPKLKTISDSLNWIGPKLRLDYKYDEPDNFLYHASDQASFVKHKIPSIFYFNGLHKDYHKTTDSPDKINFQAIAKGSQLIFITAWELANR